jgi:hypothetical protein
VLYSMREKELIRVEWNYVNGMKEIYWICGPHTVSFMSDVQSKQTKEQ